MPGEEDLFEDGEVADLREQQDDLVRLDREEDADDPEQREDDDEAGNRRDRRRQRGQLRQELDDYKRREEEWARREREMAERLARLEGATLSQQQPQQGPGPIERVQAQLRATYAREKELRKMVEAEGPNMTDARREELYEAAQANDMHRMEMAAHLANLKAGIRPHDPNAEGRAIAQAQFADIMSTPGAGQYLAGLRDMKRARGAPDTMELLQQCAEQTRIEFGLTKRPERTNGERARHADRRFQSSSAPRVEPRAVRMDEDQKRMAEAFYAERSDWSDARKHREFARMMTKDNQGT